MLFVSGGGGEGGARVSRGEAAILNLRRGCHTELRERPQSRLDVTFCFLMWIASMIFRRVTFA